MAYQKEFLLLLYRKMVLIRKFEERIKYLFLEGIMPGTIHQYQGQEGIATGFCSALVAGDVITSTHRPHGHALARGLSAESILLELFGKTTGCCKGKGGSMHIGDLEKGMAPGIAIVAGAVPMATGMALAFKMKKQTHAAVCFVGDGAVNEGAFHEGVNWSADIAATLGESLSDYLTAPVIRVASPDIPVPFSPPMENFYRPNAERVAAAARKAVGNE